MFFRRRRRRSGMGLTGLVVVAGALYFTGAGKWMWDRMLTLEDNCYAMLAQMGTGSGSGLCAGAGATIRAIDDGVKNIAENVGGWTEGIMPSDAEDRLASIQNFSDDLWQRVSNGSLSDWGSPSETLDEMMRSGPAGMGTGFSAKERLQRAIDEFTIGQHYLSSDASDKALAWLNSGASQPGGFGVLSQLTLGDLYRNGGNGIAPNPGLAAQYYGQAQQSIGLLQGSGSPEAQQMLGGLPASPQMIQQQLIAAIKQMQSGIVPKKK